MSPISATKPIAADLIDATQRLQRSHHRLEAQAFDRVRRCCSEPRHPLVGHRDGLPVFGERRLRARESKVQRRQPAIVDLAPRALPGIAHVMAQQEAFELMPGLGTGVDP